MRPLVARPTLPGRTQKRLESESRAIAVSSDPKAEAKRRYESARRAVWFRSVRTALGEMSGPGERCMFCSGSEASQVEHFRPKAVFPRLAMSWNNFLWACGVCNQSKGDRFPPDTEPGARIVDPVEEDVWAFFFIDDFGNLTARWRIDMDDQDPRAAKTIEILSLDRDVLQDSRQRRLDDLKQRVVDSLELFDARSLCEDDLRARREEWLAQPFQPDVASYFLDGPGGALPPFSRFLDIVGR
jgi:uncharacterized protein (TIGR02646 family)